MGPQGLFIFPCAIFEAINKAPVLPEKPKPSGSGRRGSQGDYVLTLEQMVIQASRLGKKERETWWLVFVLCVQKLACVT